MHLAYGAAGQNRAEAVRIYTARFPNRVIPAANTFVAIDRSVRETGSFAVHKPDAGRNRLVQNVEFEENVLEMIAANPRTSSRAIGKALQVRPLLVVPEVLRVNVAFQKRHVCCFSWQASHSTVLDVLHDEGLQPFHCTKVQDLMEDDFPARVQFSQWYLQQCGDYPDSERKLLWADEACFTREGCFNSRNSHIWDNENPHAIFVKSYQHKFSVNIWAGIVGDFILGPVLLPQRLNGDIYLAFHENVLPLYLEDVPLAIRNDMWFQHDGAPPHFALPVRHHLDALYPHRWIGRGGPFHWPARSPDYNPLDFYLWGAVKAIVYETEVDTEEELLARIILAFDEI